jgi:hypothetical protein
MGRPKIGVSIKSDGTPINTAATTAYGIARRYVAAGRARNEVSTTSRYLVVIAQNRQHPAKRLSSS